MSNCQFFAWLLWLATFAIPLFMVRILMFFILVFFYSWIEVVRMLFLYVENDIDITGGDKVIVLTSYTSIFDLLPLKKNYKVVFNNWFFAWIFGQIAQREINQSATHVASFFSMRRDIETLQACGSEYSTKSHFSGRFSNRFFQNQITKIVVLTDYENPFGYSEMAIKQNRYLDVFLILLMPYIRVTRYKFDPKIQPFSNQASIDDSLELSMELFGFVYIRDFSALQKSRLG